MSRDARRNIRKMSPIFRERQKAEDDAILTKSLIKVALTSGKLNLSGRSLSSVPNKLWTLYDSEASDITVDFKSDSSERDDIWWKQQPLINLDLSSNSLAVISPKIGDLCELTVLDLHDNVLTSLPKEISFLTKLTKLNLSRNNIVNLPKELFLLNELKYLNLSHNSMVDVHPDLSNLVMLEYLNLSYNGLTSLPDGLGFLVRLTELNVSYNKLNCLPEDIVNLRNLHKLDVMNNDIENFPEGMSELRKLECLYAQHNNIQDLPDFVSSDNLKELHISNNYIKEVPVSFCEGLYNLKVLDLRDNKIETLPNEIGMLQSLIRLDLSNNSIKNLPSTLASLVHLMSLQVDGNQIRSLRRDIIQCGTHRILKALKDRTPDEDALKNVHFERTAKFPDKYEMQRSHGLIISSQNLTEVPDEAFLEAKKANVYKVDFSKNKLGAFPAGLTKIPECLFELKSIEILLLRDNKIEKIDASTAGLGRLKKLTTLDLANNDIDSIPPILGKLTNIRSLDIVGNRFRQPRHQILEKGTEAIMMYLRDRIPA